MPRYEQHIVQAEHNKNLLDFFEGQSKQTEYSDWYVTVAFYAALHYFEAMLSVGEVVDFKHSPNHTNRNRTIKTTFRTLSDPYITLYEMSKIARYHCHNPKLHNWADAEMHLGSVKAECETLVGGKR